MRIRIARGFWTSRLGLGLLGLGLCGLLAGASIFTFYYIHFSHLIDERLTGQVFGHASHIYSAPEGVFVGEAIAPDALANYLVNDGYAEGEVPGPEGRIEVRQSSLEVYPSRNSYFDGRNDLRVDFANGQISSIHLLGDNASVSSARIEPELLTNLFDESREKRRVVRFQDIPPILLHAVLAAEDKRFFEHGGFDVIRIFGAALADIRKGEKAQGASTIDMQVARSFFFSTRRVWRRKLAETMVALALDHRFTKDHILDLYANEVYLGNRGSFAIRGFGEAAQAYFGKDIRNLDLAQCAFLAGIIRAPNHYSSPERYPERAAEARDRVLGQMVEDGYISGQQADAARREKLTFVKGGTGSRAAPYFVDMVRDDLLDKYSQQDLTTQSYRIYTTLDPQLQSAAEAAVAIGMKNVDQELARHYAAEKRKGQPVVKPQVALVVLNPATGALLALVGGRDYGQSQLDRALSRRQPGSSFKPFVYAAAFDNAVAGLQPVITTETKVVDEPTTFTFDGQDYTPDNDEGQFYGPVTTRQALTHSLNVATVKVAQMVGYDRVRQVAMQMGLNPNIQATPAMALGSYVMTPIEVAEGYTIFANDGIRAEARFLNKIVNASGQVIDRSLPQTRTVLDPRVAYLVTNVLEDVINHGTGYEVRLRGFMAPAAGKTGTSRDGWFAGYTSNLVCVVWVGYDDDRNLDLAGAQSAAPIWAEFMKRAEALPAYHDMEDFPVPPGIVQESIDPSTGELASPNCPDPQAEVFIAGTEPTQFGPGGSIADIPPVSWLAHLFGKSSKPAPPQPAAGNSTAVKPAPQSSKGISTSPKPLPPQHPAAPQKEKKRGLLEKIFGIFGGNKKPPSNQKPHD